MVDRKRNYSFKMNQYCFLSLRRSGHHAIINWAINHFHDSFFLNNYWYKWNYRNIIDKNNLCYFLENFISKSKKTKNFFFNIEDICITEYNNIQKFLPLPNLKIFSIIRNPFNLIASRLKYEFVYEKLNDIKKIKNTLSIWKKYAMNYLQGDKNCFIYDNWFLSKNYRDEIAKNIGFENNDFALNKILNIARGSSFDFVNYDNKAQKMNVLKRYEFYEKNEKFISLFDNEIFELSNKIFDRKNIPKKIIKNIKIL